MYSHRIIAFLIFTSLFFISSSSFAGLTWFILSLRSSGTKPTTDDLQDGSVAHPISKKDKGTASGTSIPDDDDDDDAVSPSAVVRLPIRRYSSSGRISPSYGPATDLLAGEEYRQSHKRRLSSESFTSADLKNDDLATVATRVKTDEDVDNQDDGLEAVERDPSTEASL